MAGPKKTSSTSEIQRLSAALESIARQYPENSDEYQAIQEAALAYLFLMGHESLNAAYQEYRSKTEKPLTKAQKAHLRSMGIEPD